MITRPHWITLAVFLLVARVGHTAPVDPPWIDLIELNVLQLQELLTAIQGSIELTEAQVSAEMVSFHLSRAYRWADPTGFDTFDFLQVDNDSDLGNSTNDTTVITGELRQIETEDLNIIPLSFSLNPDVATGANVDIVAATGTNTSYLNYIANSLQVIGIYSLDFEPGTVITDFAVEAWRTGSNGTVKAELGLFYATDAQTAGSNTMTEVTPRASLTCTSPPAAEPEMSAAHTNFSHTIQDDRQYFLCLLGQAVDANNALRLYGATVKISTQTF